MLGSAALIMTGFTLLCWCMDWFAWCGFAMHNEFVCFYVLRLFVYIGCLVVEERFALRAIRSCVISFEYMCFLLLVCLLACLTPRLHIKPVRNVLAQASM